MDESSSLEMQISGWKGQGYRMTASHSSNVFGQSS